MLRVLIEHSLSTHYVRTRLFSGSPVTPRALAMLDWEESMIQMIRYRHSMHCLYHSPGSTHLPITHAVSRQKHVEWDDDPTNNCCTDSFETLPLRYLLSHSGLVSMPAILFVSQHICLIFTYDTSSGASWDEMVTAYGEMRICCKDSTLPFLKP